MLVVLKFYMEGMENSEKISVPLLWVLHTLILYSGIRN